LKPIRLIKHAFKKLLLRSLYKRYVINNKIIQADILRTLEVRGSRVQHEPLQKQFDHLMLYYPDYAFVFFWRIEKLNYRWEKLFVSNIPCKIFRSTSISPFCNSY
jgi:hypothetical protein